MSMEAIPNDWKVNDNGIDLEHQSLFNLIQVEDMEDQSHNWSNFENFYKRLSKLMDFEEKIMTEDNSPKLDLYNGAHRSALAKLKAANLDKDPNLLCICKEILFSEISRADFYHNIYREHVNNTIHPSAERKCKIAS